MTCPSTKYPDADCFLLAGADEVIVCPRKKAVKSQSQRWSETICLRVS